MRSNIWQLEGFGLIPWKPAVSMLRQEQKEMAVSVVFMGGEGMGPLGMGGAREGGWEG